MKVRSRARALALQCLYEIDYTGHSFLEAYIAHEKSEVVVENIVDFAGGLSESSLAFAKKLGLEVENRRTELDALIARFAPEWPLEQISAIDRNILRLAVCEMYYMDETPGKVVINEAVELAKAFGGESSPRFVNGVLGAVIANKESRIA